VRVALSLSICLSCGALSRERAGSSP